jgi:hypothetical protein
MKGDISGVRRCQTREDIYMRENIRIIPGVQRCQTEGHPPELQGIYRASSLRSPDATDGTNQIRDRGK